MNIIEELLERGFVIALKKFRGEIVYDLKTGTDSNIFLVPRDDHYEAWGLKNECDIVKDMHDLVSLYVSRLEKTDFTGDLRGWRQEWVNLAIEHGLLNETYRSGPYIFEDEERLVIEKPMMPPKAVEYIEIKRNRHGKGYQGIDG